MKDIPILQLAAALHGCSTAICDKVKQSAESGIEAVVEFITKRGNELNETDISRFIKRELFEITVFNFCHSFATALVFLLT